MAKSNRIVDLPREAQDLMRHIVTEWLRAQGLPYDANHVAGAMELVEKGFAVIRSDGRHYWMEAT